MTSETKKPGHKPVCGEDDEGSKMDATAEAAAASFDEWVGQRRGKKGCVATSTMTRNTAFVLKALQEGHWDFAKVQAGHLVALYAWCHEKVYGVEPGELANGYNYSQARLAADRLVKKEFDGSKGEAIAFIKWVWKRERFREQKRREEGRTDGFRIGWRFQFGPQMVTDHKLWKARKENV